MTIQHSPARTAHVVGAIASNHTLPRQQLESIVADALQAAVIFDADATYAGTRTDAADKRPQPTSRERAHEISRAQQDAAAADMKNQWKKSTGKGGQR
ncbi:hypothetical protein BDK63_001281 [Halomonas campaniensis]|uniref:Uncharacterized protein n=1 Tax=Halomonas campaniensis TaxID=213554 RepID=A0A7W5K248_9GAMM|nr:hypothetical protein [Halomonas campaniensis]MBB3330415.1 hypothetical protein [Halomonas campaniensis]